MKKIEEYRKLWTKKYPHLTVEELWDFLRMDELIQSAINKGETKVYIDVPKEHIKCFEDMCHLCFILCNPSNSSPEINSTTYYITGWAVGYEGVLGNHLQGFNI